MEDTIKKPVYAVDFFCGAGGLTYGLKKAGINVILGIDIDVDAQKTYEDNNDVPFLCFDVKKLSFHKLKQKINEQLPKNIHRKDYHLLFAGCAPCQPFSKLKSSSSSYREDSSLLLNFYSFVQYFKPDLIFSENVPQIIKAKNVFSKFEAGLKDLNYNYCYKNINFCDYGVPQSRKRLVLLASKLFSPEINKPRVKKRTVRDAIITLPSIKAGETHPRVQNHQSASLSDKNLSRISFTSKDGGGIEDWPTSLKLNCRKQNGYTDAYGRMAWDKPAPTLTTKCISLSNGRYGHPVQDRAISLKEAALIQSYPKSYRFWGNQTTIAKHIGNSVPPKGTFYFGKYIIKSLQNEC